MTRSSSTVFRNFRFAILAVGVVNCSHDAAGPAGGTGGGGNGEPASPLSVSNSRAAEAGSLTTLTSSNGVAHTNGPGSASMSILAADANVAYISLQPQSSPSGVAAVVSNLRSGAAVTTPMVDGGFDPVALPASTGDNVSIEIRATSGATITTLSNVVPGRRPPKIVRSAPGRGKTGVPLNKNIEVVFSEPVAPSSLSSAVRLFRGNVEVAGAAEILQGVTASIVFRPTANLQPNSNYELVVTNGVRDLDGDALDSTTRVAFSTGTSVEGPVSSVTLIPNDAELRVGEQFQAVAVPKDANGNIVSGHPITWHSDSVHIATVSNTGLVTAQSQGNGFVSAVVDGIFGGMRVKVSNALRPVASVIVAFDSTGLAPGGTLLLAAIATDADGNVLPARLIQWTTSNSAVATVAAITPDQQTAQFIDPSWFHGHVSAPVAVYWANVSGIANGVAKIVASIEGQSDTIAVTVASSLPVVGFEFATDTATLLLRQAALFRGLSINSAGGRTSVPATQIQWQSSTPDVASVDANGIITGAAPGSTTITGQWNNYSASVRVTVLQLAFTSMHAGGDHTCALATDGATYCWGSNVFLQLGKPGVFGFYAFGSSIYPVPSHVADGLAFSTIVAGGVHSCGLTSGGTAYCWGNNWAGALGSGSFEDSWRPLSVTGGVTFAQIDAGGEHTCGITAGGRAYCWGWNYNDQVGISENKNPVPVLVSDEITFATLSAGGSHTCGLTADGTAYCWGLNADGELGNGQVYGSGNVATPQPVTGGLKFASVTAGQSHTCGVTRSGSAYCWGVNAELGAGVQFGSSWSPVAVAPNLNFSLIAAGAEHTCGIDINGVAYCWGRNSHGQVGVGTVSDEIFLTPQRVSGGFTFDRLTAGGQHTCARATAGVWYCWGRNENGMLGVGNITDSGTPLKVLGQQ